MRVVDLETSEPERRFSLAERIATAIVEVVSGQGACLPHDLVAKGFADEEINRHWTMAKALAYVELNIMDA